MSTPGSCLGALLTYRMGQRFGTEWIEKKIGFKRLSRVGDAIQRWRFGSILISTLASPPFPTACFFLVAAAFSFSKKQFSGAVLLGRSLRYALVTIIVTASLAAACGCCAA